MKRPDRLFSMANYFRRRLFVDSLYVLEDWTREAGLCELNGEMSSEKSECGNYDLNE
jgi:hypothetical protein